MADVDIFSVRCRDSVLFKNNQTSTLYRERDKCVITRVSGGLRVSLPAGGRPLFIPDANILYFEWQDEVKPAAKERPA